MKTFAIEVLSAVFGAASVFFAQRALKSPTGKRDIFGDDARTADLDSNRSGVTRVDAHLSTSGSSLPRFTPAKSTALQRDMQVIFETKEASHDLQVLDRSLRDIRDLTSADEAIFWRWVEARHTLVPSAWSTEGEPRPAFFNVRGWGSLVRWSAEERELQLAGDIGGFPEFASAPVLRARRACKAC